MSALSEIDPNQSSPFDDLKLKMSFCDLFYRQQCNRNYLIEELSMIHQQNELMDQIRTSLLANRKPIGSASEWDRETTRDPDVSILSQARSADRFQRMNSPAHSFASSKASRFTRKATASDAATLLLEEVDQYCSEEARVVLSKIMQENKAAASTSSENRKLRSELTRVK